MAIHKETPPILSHLRQCFALTMAATVQSTVEESQASVCLIPILRECWNVDAAMETILRKVRVFVCVCVSV